MPTKARVILAAQSCLERIRPREPLYDLLSCESPGRPEGNFLPSHAEEKRIEEHFTRRMGRDHGECVLPFD